MTVQASAVATLIDEWARSGVRDCVISPGSRSSPLAAGLAHEQRIRLHVRLDERSGAFFAIGLARATKRPVLIVTTSGTAAVELHPAVVEADLARVPLICVTADRPVELQDVGAPQTIDQVGLFGRATRYACAVDAGGPQNGQYWRSLASRLVAEATASPLGPGPVHLNLALREPLEVAPAASYPGRDNDESWNRTTRASEVSTDDVAALCTRLGVGRGVIVVGDGVFDSPPDDLYELADVLGWPVIADPRAFPREPHRRLIAHGDGLFRSTIARRELRPDVVLRIGTLPLSRGFAAFLAACAAEGAMDIVIDPYGSFPDPQRLSNWSVAASPGALAKACVAHLRARRHEATVAEWHDRFRTLDHTIERTIAQVMERASSHMEPAIARAIYAALPKGATLAVSASMPVRDIEWFAAPRGDAPRVVFNRGANGIDGVVSTILGLAAGSPADAPVVGLLGDLSLFHDLSGLVWGVLEVVPNATLVVLDNGGGGIFSFLPQSGELEKGLFERIMATPQSPDCAAVARSLGCSVIELDDGKLEAALDQAIETPGISVIVVRTKREENVAFHASLESAIVQCVEETLAGFPS